MIGGEQRVLSALAGAVREPYAATVLAPYLGDDGGKEFQANHLLCGAACGAASVREVARAAPTGAAAQSNLRLSTKDEGETWARSATAPPSAQLT